MSEAVAYFAVCAVQLFNSVLVCSVESPKHGCLHCFRICAKCKHCTEVYWFYKFDSRNTSEFLNLLHF